MGGLFLLWEDRSAWTGVPNHRGHRGHREKLSNEPGFFTPTPGCHEHRSIPRQFPTNRGSLWVATSRAPFSVSSVVKKTPQRERYRARSSSGRGARANGPVWRGTSCAARHMSSSRSTDASSQFGGSGISLRSESLVSKVSQPVTYLVTRALPPVGTVLQTRHVTPFESTNSRLAMAPVTSKDSARTM